MAAKRLFIGSFIDRSIFEYEFEELNADFQNICKGKWVEPENLHFTYKFLGDTDEGLIPSIKESLHGTLTDYHSRLDFAGLGVFPSAQKARVLVVKIFNADKTVFSIQKNIEKKMKSFGFQPEKRNFKPHLTLMRIKSARTAALKAALLKYQNKVFDSMESFSVNLIESSLTPSGPVYKII